MGTEVGVVFNKLSDRLWLPRLREWMRASGPALHEHMLEKLLAAEVLEVRVLHPAIAQSLVGKVVSVLEDRQPRHQPRRQRRLARFVGVHRPERILQKTPIDRPPQLHQRVFHVDDLIKPRAEQILLAGLPSLAWSHRKSPLHQREREESWLAIRGNPQNRIRKEIALQRPKTGKFDYLSQPNHPAHSIAFKFFTDDYFDFAILNSVLYAVQDADSRLREAHRMLKPGGELRLSGPRKDTNLELLFSRIANELKEGGLFRNSNPTICRCCKLVS
jgi:Methyltransferase domain